MKRVDQMHSSITLTGYKEMSQRLNLLALNADQACLAAVKEIALEVLRDAQENYVPVDEEDLKKSGRVTQKYNFGKLAHVEIWFGGGDTAPYALAVHEHLSEHSPRSWKSAGQGGVTFHPGPLHGPKYLERPLREAAIHMTKDVAKFLNVQTLASFRTNYGGRDLFGRFGTGDSPEPSYSTGRWRDGT